MKNTQRASSKAQKLSLPLSSQVLLFTFEMTGSVTRSSITEAISLLNFEMNKILKSQKEKNESRKWIKELKKLRNNCMD